MTFLVTPDEMLAAERAAIALGTSAGDLMRRAAEAIAGWIDEHVPAHGRQPREALALIGPGNNGGDALVALAILHERGWLTRAVLFDRETIDESLPAPVTSLRSIARVRITDIGLPDVIIDGVYGVRSRASLHADVHAAFNVARQLRLMQSTPLVAIDVPSGIDAGTGDAHHGAFPADITLCLGLPKLGLVRMPAAEFVGELELIPLGVPEPRLSDDRPRMVTEQVVRSLIPRRSAFAHKHDTGATVVVGGASTYYGAPRLASEAAARAGAGLVHAAVPRAVVPVLAAQVPEAVSVPLDDTDGRSAVEAIEPLLASRDPDRLAVVVGPGLGRDERANTLLEGLFHTIAGRVADQQPNLVIDADALNWLSDHGNLPNGVGEGCAVLTPHPGGLARLVKRERQDVESAPLDAATEAARKYRQIVVLKRGYSIVAIPDGRSWYAPRSAPELASAGTGDVLAGLIGGLLAQGLAPEDAALVAVFIGTRAGRFAQRQRGSSGVLARDIIDLIPTAMASVSGARLTFARP